MSTADSRAYSLTLLSLLMPAEHLAVFRYLLEILADTAQLSKVSVGLGADCGYILLNRGLPYTR